jgi:CBS domain-containing protein
MNSHRAAILLRAGAVVGVGAAIRILRSRVSRGALRPACVPRAQRLMTPDPIWCSATTTIDMVAQLMRHSHVDAIVVVDVEGRPIGVITKSGHRRSYRCRGEEPNGAYGGAIHDAANP